MTVITSYESGSWQERFHGRKHSSGVMKGLVRRNKQKTCRVKGCDNPRHLLWSLCLYHANRLKRTGHVSGKLYSPHYYDAERAEITDIIRRNKSHLLVTEPLGILDRLLFRSKRMGTPGLNRKAEWWLRRIQDQIDEGKTVLVDVFILLCAITLRHRRENTPFHDDLEFEVNLTTRFIRTAPGAGAALQRTALRQIQEYLKRRIYSHMIGIAEAADKAWAIQQERMARLREPLRLTDDVTEEDLDK
jgi:hypothetical protein